MGRLREPARRDSAPGGGAEPRSHGAACALVVRQYSAAKAYRRGDDEAGFELFARGVLGPEAFDGLSSERRAQAWDNVAVDKAQLLGEGFPPLSDDEVRGVAAPTLLLRGERSPRLFRLLADRLEELLPNVRRMEVPGASHIMHEDNPQVVNEAIARFLRGGFVATLAR